MAQRAQVNARKGRRYIRDRAAPYPAHRSGNPAIDAYIRAIDRDFIMKRIDMTFNIKQAQQIDALALAIDEGQAKIDAYIKQQNKPHLVARRWLRMQLIRWLN